MLGPRCSFRRCSSASAMRSELIPRGRASSRAVADPRRATTSSSETPRTAATLLTSSKLGCAPVFGFSSRQTTDGSSFAFLATSLRGMPVASRTSRRTRPIGFATRSASRSRALAL